VKARDRGALLLGGSAVLALFLGLRVIPTLVQGYATLRERTSDRVATLDRARTALGAAELVEDSFALAARELVALAPQLVAGETAAEAAAALTAEVSGMANRAGLRVVGLNGIPDSANATFVSVGVRGEFEGDLKALATFLRLVEGAPMVLTVRGLRVLAVDPLERESGPEGLRIELGVVGWRLNGEKT